MLCVILFYSFFAFAMLLHLDTVCGCCSRCIIHFRWIRYVCLSRSLWIFHLARNIDWLRRDWYYPSYSSVVHKKLYYPHSLIDVLFFTFSLFLSLSLFLSFLRRMQCFSVPLWTQYTIIDIFIVENYSICEMRVWLAKFNIYVCVGTIERVMTKKANVL